MKQMTDTMREWLTQREARREADAIIAARILKGETDVAGPDYLDLTLVNNQPRITYILPEKAEALPEPERFTKRGARVIGRPASVVQKVIGEKADGYAMDRLVQSAGIFLNPPDPAHFELLTGERIWAVFNQNNTCQCQRHNMIRSCMTGAGDMHKYRPGLVLYEDHAQIAAYTCGTCGKYEARTIVWTDSISGKRFYDRMYGSTTADHALGQILMQEGIDPLRGGVYREFPHEVVRVALTPDDVAKYDKLGWPALDTMHFLCRTCFALSNVDCPDRGAQRAGSWNYGRAVQHGAANPLIARIGGHNGQAAGGQTVP